MTDNADALTKSFPVIPFARTRGLGKRLFLLGTTCAAFLLLYLALFGLAATLLLERRAEPIKPIKPRSPPHGGSGSGISSFFGSTRQHQRRHIHHMHVSSEDHQHHHRRRGLFSANATSGGADNIFLKRSSDGTPRTSTIRRRKRVKWTRDKCNTHLRSMCSRCRFVFRWKAISGKCASTRFCRNRYLNACMKKKRRLYRNNCGRFRTDEWQKYWRCRLPKRYHKFVAIGRAAAAANSRPPTPVPSISPTAKPSSGPSASPTVSPSSMPSRNPTTKPSTR